MNPMVFAGPLWLSQTLAFFIKPLKNCSSTMLGSFELETSQALGFGFVSSWTVSVIGTLEREFNIDLSWQLRLLSIRLTKLTVSLWMSNPLNFQTQPRLRLLKNHMSRRKSVFVRTMNSPARVGFCDYIDDKVISVNIIYQIPYKYL